MKLKFKMQKALQQQQVARNSENNNKVEEELKIESSALHGLAAVAVAVESDPKGLLLDNKKDLTMKTPLDYDFEGPSLDLSKIKLEREDSRSMSPTSQSHEDTPSPLLATEGRPGGPRSISPSHSHLVNNNKPQAPAPLDSESKTDQHLSSAVADQDLQHAIPATAITCSPLPSSHQQQQVRVIKDGRFYEDSPMIPGRCSPAAAAVALLALNGKQDLRITQISNSFGCRSSNGGNSPEKCDSVPNLVNVISLGGGGGVDRGGTPNGPLALDSVKMKLGENDTQIFRAPMVSSTTNQPLNGGGVGGGGVVVTVESSMRPPAVPPRVHLPHHHGQKMGKQSPSSTTSHNHHNHQQQQHGGSSSPPTAAEEPSSSIPDLGESLALHSNHVRKARGYTRLAVRPDRQTDSDQRQFYCPRLDKQTAETRRPSVYLGGLADSVPLAVYRVDTRNGRRGQ